MIAIYLRVSTEKQKTDSQRSEIERWLVGNQGDASVRWYEDVVSGKDLERTAFHSLESDIFAGEVDMVVVWKLDRLSRNLRDGINVLYKWCERGLRVVSVTQNIDLSGPVGRMIAAVMLGLAEIEREHILERQRAGIELAKNNHVYIGRRPGAIKVRGGREKARNLAKRGFSTKESACVLGVSQRTVARYLS